MARKTGTDKARAAVAAAEGAEADTAEAGAATVLRKKALIDRVVAASGMKRKDVKPVVEATLAVLGEALSGGEALNLQPLGKLVVNRKKELDNGEVLVTRIRRSTQALAGDAASEAETPAAPLAEPAE